VRADSAPPLVSKLVTGKTAVNGVSAAYVCRDFTCERPETDPAALETALEG
jgi:uncharacterized protein